MPRTWSPILAVALAVACALVSAAFVSPMVSASSPTVAGISAFDGPPRTGIWPVNFTFYGDASKGWGFGSANITEPGPTITVYLGDILNLTLIGTDSNVMHNWFIDYNNDLQPSSGEPQSPDFMSGSPLVWNFTAMSPGTWTYRCGHHPNSMTGTIVVLAQPRPVNLTLHGNAGLGWGFSNATIHEPGPPLVVLFGTNVILTLIASDSNVDHDWFIDYDNSLAANGVEPVSHVFNSASPAVFLFTADQSGNYTYRCGFHPNSMTGNITILGGPTVNPNLPITFPLITTIMYIALGGVAVFAAVYHVRAVRASKRAK